MRRNLILLTLVTLGAFGVVATSAQTSGGCTWSGTPHRDIRTGGPTHDELCSKAGPDFVHGAAGNDGLKAGKGRDTVVGGGGRDHLKGGKGKDRLFAVDDRGGETVVGRPGIDQCFVDPGDQVSGCEQTFRSNEPQMAEAYSRSLLTVMDVAEVPPSPTPMPPPPPPIVTVTVTPDCNDHPAPPPIC